MGKILTVIGIVSGVLFAVVSCSTNTCRENVSALPLATFYSSSTENEISVDSLTVYGVGVPGDSAIIRNGNASMVYLPFRVSASSCGYVFHYEQKLLSDTRLNDTLTVNYKSNPMFTSVECGAMYFYEITGLSCTNHLIDSVAVVNASITNVESETIRIFFRTAEPDDDGDDSSGDMV